MSDYLRVGVVTTTHGVKGEMKVFPTTDDMSRFSRLKELKAITRKGEVTWKIQGVKYFKQFVILKVEGIDDMDTAALYRNTDLMIPKEEALPLEENEYYLSDIIGLTVVTEDGKEFGEVVEVLQTGANDCYEIRRPGEKNTVLLPAIASCVLKVDLEQHRMVVRIPEGLL